MTRYAFLIALLSGCDGSGSAGESCSTGSDCGSDLQCLDTGQVFTNSTTCTDEGKECTISCATDSDCAKLGDNFKCFQACGAYKRCGPS